ncbi:MAG TPA: hypothetical protein VEB21_02620 [Terriglobales bacterium]|nr:hypothetical protein [Terriglobales bacterium]
MPVHWNRRRPFAVAAVLFAVALGCRPASAQAGANDVEALRREVQELRRRDEENRKRLAAMEQALERLQSQAPPQKPPATAQIDADDELDKALAEASRSDSSGIAITSAQPGILSRQVGGMNLRLIDVSFDIMSAAGTSTERGDALRDLQAGAHDPTKRGFTLQQGELSLAGAVDPYLVGEAHMVFTTDHVELEEAFLTTQALPYRLQLEAGYFLTEFGLVNPLHAHAWEFIDQPLIVSRLLGFEGLRSPGGRLAWLAPLPWFSELHFGVQNANEGSFTRSFAGSSIGGRPTFDRDVRSLGGLLYLARWNNSWNVTANTTAVIGVSSLYGPNASGPDGETWIYGADLRVRWRPPNSFMGWPYVTWQTEVMKRDYAADWYVAGSIDDGGGGDHGHDHGHEHGAEEDSVFPNDLPGGILRDVGMYTQLLYGFRWGWQGGLRFEYAGGHRPSVVNGLIGRRQDDPFRDDRLRLSPLLSWRPTEFSRFRLQYNYDHARHLHGNHAHSVWLGAEVLYGSHAAHRF